MELLVKKLSPGAQLPSRATEGSAGYDLCACLPEPMTIGPGKIGRVPTGIALLGWRALSLAAAAWG